MKNERGKPIQHKRSSAFVAHGFNHAMSNLAIYSPDTSQDKLPEALNRQSIIATQVHDQLHEKLFISTCSSFE